MKKKKLLFVCASLKVGGAEKSLVNLLNIMDYQKYDVSLLLLQKQGEFLKQVPEAVKLIELPRNARALYDIVPFSGHNYLLKFVKYTTTMYEKVIWRQYDKLRAHRWKDFYSKICESMTEKFDVVIAFQSGESTYYGFDKIKAGRYITYYHTDVHNISFEKDIENKYLKKADLIVTISPECVKSVNDIFPQFKDKTICLENLSSKDLIERLAGNLKPEEFDFEGKKIVSVGRLIDIKGFDMVIDASKILKEEGLCFKWFIIGEGSERKKLEQQIKDNKVEDCVCLIGLKTNPYPYMKYADLIVQSSRYEGKSMVLDEAKILKKNILVTNYKSAKDQIEDGVDGYICEINHKAIAEGVNKSFDKPVNLQKIHRKTTDLERYMKVLLGE